LCVDDANGFSPFRGSGAAKVQIGDPAALARVESRSCGIYEARMIRS